MEQPCAVDLRVSSARESRLAAA